MLISLMCCLDLSSKGVMMQQNMSIPSKLFGILHYAHTHIPINLYHASLGMLCLCVCEDDSTAMSRSEFRAKSNETCTMLANNIERNQ